MNGRLDVALAAGCGLHAPEAYPRGPLSALGLLALSRPTLRISGFLLDATKLGQEVRIRTITAKVHAGRLRIQSPSYGHTAEVYTRTK